MRKKHCRRPPPTARTCTLCHASSDDASNYQKGRQFFINVCDGHQRCLHTICSQCRDRELDSATAKSFVCPVCSAPIRKNTLHEESIEQVDAVRDRQERRKVAKVFNKTRADFESAEEYNSFLEAAEDIVYKLVHGIDKKETESELERYRKEHQNDIAQNESKKAERRDKQQKALAMETKLLEASKLKKQQQEERHEKDVEAAMKELNSVQLQELDSLSTKLPSTLDGADILPDKPVVTSLAPTSLGLVQPKPLVGEIEAEKTRQAKREFLRAVRDSDRPRIRVAGGCQLQLQTKRGWSEVLAGLQ